MVIRQWTLLLLAAMLLGAVAEGRAQPVFQATGTANSGVGAVTVAWPTHLAGDVALLFVESQRDQPVTLSTPAGFVEVPDSPQFTNAGTGTRLTVFWARATSAAMTSPTIADAGDHVYGVIVTYRRVINTGDPWDVTSGGVKNTASTSVSVTGLTTTVNNTRVVQAVARDNDSATAAFSGQTNGSLTGITERSDGGTTSGHGGGIGIWDGLDATGGTVNNTTATVTSSVNAFISIALRPATTFYSRASANWNTTTTWSAAGCGGSSAAQVPPAGVDVVICNGNTVVLDTTASPGSVTIQNGGTLTVGVSGSNTNRILNVSGDLDNAGLLQYGNNNGDHQINVGGQFINSGTFTHINNTSGGARSLTVTGLLNNSGTFTFAGRANNGEIITVNSNGGLVNSGTLEVDVNSNNTHVMNVRGDFTDNGTVQFAPDGNSLANVIFNGSVAQAMTGTASATTTFYNVTLNNSSGLTLTGTHNMTVSNVLTLTSGVLTTGSNVLAVTNTAAGGVTRTAGFVEGGLTWTLPTGNPGVRTFPVGTGTTYSPAELTFTGISTGGTITVRAIAGDHPDVANSGVDEALSVNRYWTIANAGVVFTDYAAVFNWVAGDLDVGADTSVFEAQRLDGTWNATTPGTRTATSMQITGVTGFGEFAIGQPFSVAIGIGRFNAYDTTTAGGAVSGYIMTKVAGTAFNVDIIAIVNNRKSINTGFTGEVIVELLNASDNSGVADTSTGCRSSWTVIQTITPNPVFVGGDNGRKTISVTENNAWREARFRIRNLAGFLVGCSTDALAIRPASLTVSASDADWATAGSGRTLSNGSATGGNVHKAGQPFTLNVAAAPVSATNYDGMPTLSALACTVPGGCVNGTLDMGSFSGTGTRVSNTATYSEAGVFNLTLIDETYTLVDAVDGSPADCSASGRFICQSPAPATVGRFVPDRFVFSSPSTPTLLTFGSNSCGTRSFTYVGQPFWYDVALLPSATLQAVNAAGVVTANYPLNTASGRPTISENYSDTTAPVAAPLDATGIGSVAASSGAGTGSYTASTTGVLRYTRSGTTPVSEFNAAISLAVTANDATEAAVTGNGTITSPAVLTFNGGGSGIAFDAGTAMRYGRLRLVGASGARQLPLRVPFETQYWTGTFFAVNAQDSCTSVTNSNVALGNNIGSLTTAVTAVSALSGGRGRITLSAPNASGSVDLAILLGPSAAICPAFAPAPGGSGNLTWLRGQWCGSNYDRDPTARARFGIRKGSSEVIFMRENF